MSLLSLRIAQEAQCRHPAAAEAGRPLRFCEVHSCYVMQAKPQSLKRTLDSNSGPQETFIGIKIGYRSTKVTDLTLTSTDLAGVKGYSVSISLSSDNLKYS